MERSTRSSLSYISRKCSEGKRFNELVIVKFALGFSNSNCTVVVNKKVIHRAVGCNQSASVLIIYIDNLRSIL